MIKPIEVRIDKLDGSLHEVLKKMEDHPGTIYRIPDEKWSPAQVLYHLYTSERGTVNYLQKKIQTKEVHSAGIRGLIASFLLRRALKNQKKKYKAPKILGEMEEKPDFTKLKDEYLNIRKELRKILSEIDKKQARKAYFKHPIAGKLNIYQTLSFLEDHFERHKLQIYERLD